MPVVKHSKQTLSLSQKILKAGIIAIFFTILGSLISYAVRIFYARSLPIEEFGLFFGLFTFANVISNFTDFGFGEACTYFVPKYLKAKKYHQVWNVFKLSQTIQFSVSFILAILVWIFSPYLATKFFTPAAIDTIKIFGLFLVASTLLNSIFQLFLGLQKEKYYSSIIAVRMIFILVSSLVFSFLYKSNAFSYSIIWFMGYLLTFLIFTLLLYKNYPQITKNKFELSKEIFNSMLAFAIPSVAATTIYSYLYFSDTLFLTIFRNVTELGIYNVVYPLASVSLILLNPLTNLFFPLTSDLMEGERKKLSFLVTRILQIIPILAVYFCIFLITYPDQIVAMLFGQKWIPLTTTPLIIFSLSYIFSSLSIILGNMVLGLGKIHQRLKTFTVIALINLLLNGTLTYIFGITGTATSSLIISALTLILILGIIRQTVDFKIPYYHVLKLLVIAVILFILFSFLPKPASLLTLVVLGIVYTLVYLSLIYGFKMVDKNLILIMLPKKLKSIQRL